MFVVFSKNACVVDAMLYILVVRHSSLKNNAELIKRRIPVSDRHCPFFCNVFSMPDISA
jgi:hypothetical protein